jgi:hypothetical protein
MAKLCQVAIARRALPVRSLGGVLGERCVADVVQGLHLPVVPDQLGQLGRGDCSVAGLVTA